MFKCLLEVQGQNVTFSFWLKDKSNLWIYYENITAAISHKFIYSWCVHATVDAPAPLHLRVTIHRLCAVVIEVPSCCSCFLFGCWFIVVDWLLLLLLLILLHIWQALDWRVDVFFQQHSFSLFGRLLWRVVSGHPWVTYVMRKAWDSVFRKVRYIL